MIGKEKSLEEWLNVPAILETEEFGSVEGMIKYGVRLPIRSGITPLVEYDLDSKEKIGKEKPAYWFVNNDQSIKVKLLITNIKEREIKGIGRDSEIFKYTIKRK